MDVFMIHLNAVSLENFSKELIEIEEKALDKNGDLNTLVQKYQHLVLKVSPFIIDEDKEITTLDALIGRIAEVKLKVALFERLDGDLWKSVPNEIFFKVLSFIELDDIVPCMRVGKRWLKILQIECVLKSICPDLIEILQKDEGMPIGQAIGVLKGVDLGKFFHKLRTNERITMEALPSEESPSVEQIRSCLKKNAHKLLDLNSISLCDLGLYKIPAELEMLKALETLGLSNNKIKKMENLNLPNLKKLYLTGNQIECIEGLGKCRKLKFLHLRDNQIPTLNGLQECRSLQHIDLTNNKIDSKSREVEQFIEKAVEALPGGELFSLWTERD